MDGGAFDDLTDLFESTIDWPKRLGFEEPFYRGIFQAAGVKSVVDVACGTGHHAGMFHSWGLRVEGSDLSPNMIARATASFGQAPDLRWAVRGYDQPINAAEPFDAAICVGNSLALAPSPAIAGQAIVQMLAAVRPGGLVVIHVLNVWAMPDGPCVWQKNVRAKLPEGPAIILRGVHRCGQRAFVEILVRSLDDQAKLRSASVPFWGLEASLLELAMRDGGARQVSIFGGYGNQAYEPGKSADLVMVGQK